MSTTVTVQESTFDVTVLEDNLTITVVVGGLYNQAVDGESVDYNTENELEIDGYEDAGLNTFPMKGAGGISWQAGTVAVPVDTTSINPNDVGDLEIKGFKAAANSTVIHKRADAVAFVDENEAKAFIDFTDGTGVTGQARRLFWNDADKTLNLGLSTDVTLQIGQEMHLYVRNVNGSELVNGDIVFISGATGQVPNVEKAIATDYDQSLQVIAMVTEASIADNGFGYVTTIGLVRDLNTSALTEGALVYLSETVAGGFQSSEPVFPNNSVAVGYCLYQHASQGKILFFPKLMRRKFGAVTAGNYSAFKDDGALVAYGNARRYRDELGDALSLRVQGSGLSADPTEAVVNFSATSDLNDFLYKNLQLNHDRDLSATHVFPHIHFLQNQSAVPNFLFRYRWQINGGAKVTTWTDLICQTPVHTYTTGTLDQIVTTTAGIAVPVGSTLSDIIQFKIFRDNANASGAFSGADAYTGDASVLSFDVHILLDGFGSATQGSK